MRSPQIDTPSRKGRTLKIEDVVFRTDTGHAELIDRAEFCAFLIRGGLQADHDAYHGRHGKKSKEAAENSPDGEPSSQLLSLIAMVT